MSSKRERESMERMDKVFKVVQQSSTEGINAAEIAKKIGIHRSTVHRNLVSLELMGKVENTGGMWRAKTGEQTIKPLEKEILIMLPLPRKLVQYAIAIETHAKYVEDLGMPKLAAQERIILEKIDESRSIRITGRNVDALDLEKLGNMIQQANQKSSIFNLKGVIKKLKIPRAESKGQTAKPKE